MNDSELRVHFGLVPCLNPEHSFKLKNLIGAWRIARESWAVLQDGRLNKIYLSFHSIESVDGFTAYSIVVWRLKVIWGFLK